MQLKNSVKDRPKILVVDDDKAHRTMLKALFTGWGYNISEADDGKTAIEEVNKNFYDLVMMDIRMLKISGMEALDKIKSFNPSIPVIIMTAYSSVETAVEALKKGAYDYLTKPFDFDKLRLTIERAMDHIKLKEENRLLKESLGKHFNRQNIVGQSLAMTRLLETVSQVAASEAAVLINGESGTGKELIAGAIHYNSSRKENAFIKINCAAIAETLLESELFGHEKGSFTGADRKKEGRFVQAHGGTLFLDEVSEMPLTMQAKLLRVIQEKEVTRVGGETVISVDVRVIAATNKNLMDLIKVGSFREDLYYRLNVVNLSLPPLRDRREDIPLLSQKFLEVFMQKNHKQLKGFSPQALDLLIRYNWPGNVRELMNAIERAVVLTRTEYLYDEDFSMLKNSDDLITGTLPSYIVKNGENNFTSLYEVERTTILQTLKSVDGNKSKTARSLGITRKTLHKKLKEYNEK